MRPRARDCGIIIGALSTGAHNAITDVAGVKVGHSTLIEGEGPLTPGAGPVRTGVTAIWPHSGDLFHEKVAACVHTINGFGEVTNSDQVHEMGVVEGPILITNTLNVARVADYAIDWAFVHYPQMGITDWGISPVVAETSDMYLNDIRGRHVQREHVFAAIDHYRRRHRCAAHRARAAPRGRARVIRAGPRRVDGRHDQRRLRHRLQQRQPGRPPARIICLRVARAGRDGHARAPRRPAAYQPVLHRRDRRDRGSHSQLDVQVADDGRT